MEQTELAEPKTNLPKVLSEIEKIKGQVGDLAIKMSANKVKTDEDFSLAVTLGKQANEAIKEFERKRDEIIKPAKSFVEKVRDTVKAITTPIESAKNELKERCEDFNRKKREAQAREAEKLRLQQIKVEEQALTADSSKEQEKLLQKSEKLAAKIETVITEKPKASIRRREFRIVEAALIPRAYLVPDEKAIRKAGGGVDDPIPTIPGIEFYNDEKVAFS